MAEVHLTAYRQRIVPMIHGEVTEISVDRLSDPKTSNPYYTALSRLNMKELAESPGVELPWHAGECDDRDQRVDSL